MKNYYFKFRHVITAGHCVCPTVLGNPGVHKDAICKPQGTELVNQIDPGNNKVSVYGGSSDRVVLGSSIEYWAEKAYLMMSPKNGDFVGTFDIGIIFTYIPLFDKSSLRRLLPDDKPPILPICLGSQDLNFDKEKIYGVGWGKTYDQSPKNKDPGNPYYSSCMTNEVGDEDWRFQACNMKKIIKNRWSCEKKKFPPEYYGRSALNPSDYSYYFVRCKKYWIGAKRMFENTDKSKIKFLDRVQKILINEEDTGKEIVCYNEKEFAKTGWCEVHGEDIAYGAWGFCSPSCNQDLMRVRKLVSRQFVIFNLHSFDYLHEHIKINS